jgi:hypothetical protein
MARKMDDVSEVKVAVANSVTSGALAGTKINAAGYGRARFVFTFGQPLANASLSSAGVWQAATSGATFASIAAAQLAAVTSGAISDVAMVLDTAVDPTNPWLLISGAMATSSIYHSATVTLYNGTRLVKAATALAQQTVSVG